MSGGDDEHRRSGDMCREQVVGQGWMRSLAQASPATSVRLKLAASVAINLK